jgi:RNA-binding protein YhbY
MTFLRMYHVSFRDSSLVETFAWRASTRNSTSLSIYSRKCHLIERDSFLYTNHRREYRYHCSESPNNVGPAQQLGLTQESLQEAIRQGHAMQVIRVGRRGACEDTVNHIKNRWNTSNVVKLRCSGRPSYNMKQLAHELESKTGGTIIFRSGGSIILYKSTFIDDADHVR